MFFWKKGPKLSNVNFRGQKVFTPSPLQRSTKNETRKVYLSCCLGRKWPTQMIWQALNLPLPFPRKFYAANILRTLAVRWIYLRGLCGYVMSNLKASQSFPKIFMHANALLDKFLDGFVVIVLVFGVLPIGVAFGVLAKLAWTTRGSSDKTMKAVRSRKASNWNTSASFRNSVEGPNSFFRYNVS